MQLARCQAFSSGCACVRLGLARSTQACRIRRHGPQMYFPLFFFFHHLTRHWHCLVVTYLPSSTQLVSSSTSYSLHRIVQLPAVSVPLRAALTISRSSMIFSPRLSRYSLPPASSPPFSSTSYSSRLAWQPRRQYPHRHRTCRVLHDIIHTTGILIDIVLVASCLT